VPDLAPVAVGVVEHVVALLGEVGPGELVALDLLGAVVDEVVGVAPGGGDAGGQVPLR